ncbi:MAG: preprotein translocase subunit SecY [Patescibacteria group bacterium]|nr:preprotein translocase subunit SecY [Patescibacteria group bacterium]
MWYTFKKIFSHPELRKRVFLTAGLLVLVRFLAHVPLPGVDPAVLHQFFSQNQLFGLLNMFAGGTMENFSIVLMGVGPYITASIIIQLLTLVIPALENLSKEGASGQQKINQYVRMLAVPFAAIQSVAMISLLSKGFQGVQIEITGLNLLTAVIVVTAGTMLLMWIGEIISEEGIGNGISLIIALGIIAGIPAMIRNTYLVLGGAGSVDTSKILGLVIFIAVTLAVIFLIVFFNESERRIPVSYARHVRGRRTVGGVDTYLPLKPAQAGVIPIIFALSILVFPTSIAEFLKTAKSQLVVTISEQITAFLSNTTYHTILYFMLTFAFTFFYTGIIFSPQKISDNLQKQGGYVPGKRPGGETRSYLSRIMYQVVFLGAVYLSVIAILPFILEKYTGLTTIAIGGTGLLIMVSVVLETVDQFKAMMLMRQYDE